MPLVFLCGGCGNSLYAGLQLRSPRDILNSSGGRCGKCGVTLRPAELDLQVTAIASAFEGSKPASGNEPGAMQVLVENA